MPIRYEYLTQEGFPQAHATMVEAFSDYQLDMSHMTRERSLLRNRKSGVQYDCSVGAFDAGKMVGFTFVGLDEWRGEYAAFDAGTGIIPGFRGQGIAKGMFEFIIPGLRERGVSSFLLEVLKPNTAAIRAYTKAGFRPTREFACYDLLPGALSAKTHAHDAVEVRVIDKDRVQTFESLVDWQPSWENSFSGMKRIQDELIQLGAFRGDQCVGMLVYYPLLQWVMSLVVINPYRRKGIASGLMRALLAELPGSVDAVKIVNIDKSDHAMLAFVQSTGAEHVIDQYEMEYRFQ